MRRTCLDMVHDCARRDPRVVFIGSDLGAGTLDSMRGEMPERFFMEGIAEQNLIGMAAGMAMEGYVPFVNTIATFITRRATEQVAVDLCLHRLPVRLIGNGGGLVYAPLGPTHEAVEDIALMRALPGMTVVAATDARQMKALVPATLDWPGPVYIRLAKGGDPVVFDPETERFEIGRAITKRSGADVAVIACGVMVKKALDAADLLAAEGIDCTVIDMHTVKPLDDAALCAAARDHRLVVTAEEHSRIGGLGSAVLESLADADGPPVPVLRLALPDAFAENYGSQDGLLERAGLQPAPMAAAIRARLARLEDGGNR